MIFSPPEFLPTLPSPLPLQEEVGDFVLSSYLARIAKSDAAKGQPCFVDAATDRAWQVDEISSRIGKVAAALCARFQITPGQTWHGTVALLSSNSIDALILSWAVHRIGGGCLMLQPTSSADEIVSHLDHVPPLAMFVSQDLLALGQDAVRRSSLAPKLPLFELSMLNNPAQIPHAEPERDPSRICTLEDLVVAAQHLPALPKSSLSPHEASHRVAYYCTTSGTGGIQRIVAITHENIIACILQAASFYKASRQKSFEVNLGFLPFNHIYGLLIVHTLFYLGDSVIIHRGFNLMDILTSIDKYRINSLFLVPPIINAISRNAAILNRFDLSSVRSITSGGGPLNKEDFTKIQAARPTWRILSGWGQTEGCGIGTLTPPDDIFPGSSGVLLPGVRIRLRDDSGGEVEAHEEMGEIEIESPSILRGYVDSAGESLTPPAEKTDFWWSTGDVGLFRKSPSGQSHLFVVDRIRDMIKVKGNQVAPGQIETQLSRHGAVAEVAVVGVKDEVAGERALAFIIREPKYAPDMSEAELRAVIRDHNDLALPEVCRLQDRILFVDAIPKSASGKVLKRELKKQVSDWPSKKSSLTG